MTRLWKTDKPKTKPCILIASVLKPAQDIRAYHKLGKSLAGLFPNYDIHTLGSKTSTPTPQPENPDVQIHTYPPFSRLGWGRIRAAWTMWRLASKLKPRVLVLTAGELLPWGLLFKIYPGGILLYDVQENYFRNIRYTHAYRYGIRKSLAYLFRAMEWLCSRGVQGYLLAESCYQDEIPFIRRRKSLVLPNKMDRNWLPPGFHVTSPLPGKKISNFLLTGTLSLDYGLFEAIEWARSFQEYLPSIRLKLCGYVPRDSDYRRLLQLEQKFDFLELQVGRQALPYEEILEAMLQCDGLLMPYRVNRSVAQRIPTKIYECLALRKPMLIQKNPAWEGFLATFPFQSAVFWDFQALAPLGQLSDQLSKTHFYQNATYIPHIYWQEEEGALRQFFLPWIR